MYSPVWLPMYGHACARLKVTNNRLLQVERTGHRYCAMLGHHRSAVHQNVRTLNLADGDRRTRRYRTDQTGPSRIRKGRLYLPMPRIQPLLLAFPHGTREGTGRRGLLRLVGIPVKAYPGTVTPSTPGAD